MSSRLTHAEPLVADYGLLESVLARPRSTVLGHDATPLSTARLRHCCTPWRRTTASLTATSGWPGSRPVVFCHINGWRVDAPDDGAYDFVIAIADGTLTELQIIADTLEGWSRSPDSGM